MITAKSGLKVGKAGVQEPLSLSILKRAESRLSEVSPQKGPTPVSTEAFDAAAEKLLAENPLFAVGEAEIRGNTYRVFKNAPPSLVGLYMHGTSHGDEDFLLYQDERFSFMETFKRACRFAHALKNELNVQPGDRIAIAMRNYPEWCFSYMAITMLGAVVVPLNAWWKTDELEYALKDCEAKTIIVDAKRLSHLLPLKSSLGLTLVLARDEGEGADYRYETLMEASTDETLPPVSIEADDDFCILYTSGSTGRPKGVILTHRGCISTLLSWAFIALSMKDANNGISLFGEKPGILLGIPLFHVTGSHSIFLLSYLVGRRVAMMYRWDAKEAVSLINKEELSNFVGVPSQSFELIEAAGDIEMPSMIDIGSGGAKRPADHVRKLADKFPQATPSSGYGLSETNAAGCVISRTQYMERPNSTGKALPPVTDIKIVNVDDDALPEMPTGEVGEVWIRSPANFRGYLNLPDATQKSITDDGWFRTGDLGKLDEDGYLYIVDRMKDLIIRGGENISCLEVEARVYEHPDIAEAVVFSVPEEVLGERVGLVVYPKEGVTPDVQALRDFIAEDLASFKVPERIWISPSALPRLGTEKFDKIMVRTIALAHPPMLKTD